MSHRAVERVGLWVKAAKKRSMVSAMRRSLGNRNKSILDEWGGGGDLIRGVPGRMGTRNGGAWVYGS